MLPVVILVMSIKSMKRFMVVRLILLVKELPIQVLYY